MRRSEESTLHEIAAACSRGRASDQPSCCALILLLLLTCPSLALADSPAADAAHVEMIKNRAPLSSGEVPPDVYFLFGDSTAGSLGLQLQGGQAFGLMLSGVPGGWWGGAALLLYHLSDWPRAYIGAGLAGGSAALEVTKPDTGGEMPGAAWALDACVGVDYGIGFAEFSLMSGTMSEPDREAWRGMIVPRFTLGFRVGP